MDEVYAALERCGTFVAAGTSGVVYPAAGFVAAARGARTIEVNLGAVGRELGLRRAAARARGGTGALASAGAAEVSGTSAALALTTRLLALNTINPPGEEAAAIAVVGAWLEDAGSRSDWSTWLRAGPT